jgi:hypothetical protein
MELSTNFYQLGNSQHPDLDLRELNGSERELNGYFLASRKTECGANQFTNWVRTAPFALYSTSRGAVYPGFVITEYFTGLPFSLMRNASPV